jgi:cadmium resistance protein CadD (predicted permease)
VTLGLLGQAAGMFAVTNIDDLLVLAVFFGQAAGSGGGAWRVVIGQYLGFAGILAAAIVGALGAGLLPDKAIPYLGLLPLALGIRAAVTAWREHRTGDSDDDASEGHSAGPGVLQVAAVTFANGGDNIGVYVPVFTVAGLAAMSIYAVVFLIGVGLWCAAGWYLGTRPVIARTLSRWGHIILPVVLIGIGTLILVEGGAFGL